MIGFITVDKNVAGFSPALPSVAWIFLFGFALFSTVLPYILLNQGLKEVDASQAGVMLLVEPISVVLMGVLILQETLNYWQIIGGFLILFSVVIIKNSLRFVEHP